jgi:hypothetical protein
MWEPQLLVQNPQTVPTAQARERTLELCVKTGRIGERALQFFFYLSTESAIRSDIISQPAKDSFEHMGVQKGAGSMRLSHAE